MPEENKIFQVSTLQALMLGAYQGLITAEQFRQKGNFGIGTFDGLNGEMIMLEGTVYRAAGDGHVETADDNDTIPFGEAAFFNKPLQLGTISVSNIDSLKEILDKEVLKYGRNRIHLIRIDAMFDKIHVRSVLKQGEPYEPMNAVMEKDQRFYTYENVTGTIIGIYAPQYMDRITASGWHMHFISADKTKGGHLLDLSVKDGLLLWNHKDGFEMILPDNDHFHELDLDRDQSEDIRKIETGH